jgi:hypothetical protein
MKINYLSQIADDAREPILLGFFFHRHPKTSFCKRIKESIVVK